MENKEIIRLMVKKYAGSTIIKECMTEILRFFLIQKSLYFYEYDKVSNSCKIGINNKIDFWEIYENLFGVFASLLRRGFEVIIFDGEELIKIEYKKILIKEYEKEKMNIDFISLHDSSIELSDYIEGIVIKERNKQKKNKSYIEILGVEQPWFDEFTKEEFILKTENKIITKEGEILLNKKYKGKLYKDGLYKNDTSYLYGYNILNDDDDYYPKSIKKILNELDDKNVILELWKNKGIEGRLYFE